MALSFCSRQCKDCIKKECGVLSMKIAIIALFLYTSDAV